MLCIQQAELQKYLVLYETPPPSTLTQSHPVVHKDSIIIVYYKDYTPYYFTELYNVLCNFLCSLKTALTKF